MKWCGLVFMESIMKIMKFLGLFLCISFGFSCDARVKRKKTAQHVQPHVVNVKQKTKGGGFFDNLCKKNPNGSVYFDRGPLSELNQGTLKANTFEGAVKTCKLYKQFSTLALFDVVKLDENLVRLLIDKKCETRGWTQQERDLHLMRLLEDVTQSHVFYICADVRDAHHEEMSHENASWRLKLKEGSSYVTPQKIVEADLDAETLLLFGSTRNEHATIYRVTFDRDPEQQGLTSLVFSSPLVEDALVWVS